MGTVSNVPNVTNGLGYLTPNGNVTVTLMGVNPNPADSSDNDMSDEDEMDDEELLSCNEDSSSSGPSCNIAPNMLPNSNASNVNNFFSNPAASLVTVCPCGCRGKINHELPESPDSSPSKVSMLPTAPVCLDLPLDMSKNGPNYSTPPPSPPDREKFRSLFMLCDVALQEWDIKNKKVMALWKLARIEPG